MATATITSKGQITIPAAIRSDLHVSPGDRVEFVRVTEGRYEFIAATQDVSALRGIVKVDKAVSVDDMNEAIKAKAGK
jgi:AbrB family looped-hinge helix DNA binding protein